MRAGTEKGRRRWAARVEPWRRLRGKWSSLLAGLPQKSAGEFTGDPRGNPVLLQFVTFLLYELKNSIIIKFLLN